MLIQVYKPVSLLEFTARRCRLLQSPILAGNDPIKTANAELIMFDITGCWPVLLNRYTVMGRSRTYQDVDVLDHAANTHKRHITGQAAVVQIQLRDVAIHDCHAVKPQCVDLLNGHACT